MQKKIKKVAGILSALLMAMACSTAVMADETAADLSYEGYDLKWEDKFEGDTLDRNDWNVELHDPGWVNNELQAYVDSPENIYIENGKLVIKPIKKVKEDGSVSYTSGRVNTRNKQNFKYGLFEARAKVPKGKGFLPAFWMKPADETLYGQWPRGGEIDIMEVLGHETKTTYGTIHYGNPHGQSQGKHTLENGTFSDEYHDFAVEWEPGRIIWYVDGKKIYTENNWYSASVGQGEFTYPAPFDQPFYVILNLAVGGNWPGNPDGNTDFENSAFYIDYVRIYQKDHYDENVSKPVEEVVLRDPDENGNYIINGDFSSKENLKDDKDWKFLTTSGGAADAVIENNEMIINISQEGNKEHSVQLVQPDLPMKKGGKYQVTFSAYADQARKMKVNVSAPDRAYRRYLEDTVINLTEEKKTYTLDFTMTDKDDANGRLEFNMGACGSTAGIRISDVTLKKTGEIEITEGEKGVLADGNHVYNGGFQEGEDRLGYWEVAGNKDAVKVTNENNIRRLMIDAPEGTSVDNPIIISQNDLALTEGTVYSMSFTAEGDTGKKVIAKVAGTVFTANLTGAEKKYEFKLTLPEKPADTNVLFSIEEPGVYYIDNVRIEEDCLIKNGSFDAGFSGYEPFVDSSISSDITYTVDSLQEDNAAEFIINNTGDAAWKIQMKQKNVKLEKGQWYKFSYDAKSSLKRNIIVALQKDGSSDNGWKTYFGKTVELGNEYTTYESTFQMTDETNPDGILNISMGAVDGVKITKNHRICIDNINLEKIEPQDVNVQPVGKNLLINSNFANGSTGWKISVNNPGKADVTFKDGRVVYKITEPGDKDWCVQLKQPDILLVQGGKYRASFKAKSTKARTVKFGMLSAKNEWYGGRNIELDENEEKEVVVDFVMDKATDPNSVMVISMGTISGIDTPASTIELSDFSLIRTAEYSVDYKLTNLKATKRPTAVESGMKLEVVLAADTDYRLPEHITVKMGEKTLESSAYTYNKDNGKITIISVTGNVEITAEGVKTLPPAVFEKVTGIVGMPTEVKAGKRVEIKAVATPSNATHRDIGWEIIEDGGTGAYIEDGNFLITESKGELTLLAVIKNGLAEGEDYIQEFPIVVVKTASSSDADYVSKAGSAVKNGSYEIEQSVAEDESVFIEELARIINKALKNMFGNEAERIENSDISNLAITVEPAAGDEGNHSGEDGEFTFDVKIHKGDAYVTVPGLTGTIKATPYTDEGQNYYTTGIKIKSKPDKTTYEIGEDFDSAGMKVVAYEKASSSNAARRERVLTEDEYDVEVPSFETPGTKTVRILYEAQDKSGNDKVFRDSFTVKVRKGSSTGDSSDSSYSSSGTVYDGSTTGTWSGGKDQPWKFRKSDGSYAADEWVKVKGLWYHFDASGNMQTGWIFDQGKWYMLNADGIMHSNVWILVNGKWYFLNGDGSMKCNEWFLYNGFWYYLGKDGDMVTDCLTPDGCRVDAEGKWVQ